MPYTIEDRADAVATELIGTAKSLHDEATEAEMNDTAFCTALDQHVFECAGCGWWCGTDEENDSDEGPKCNDCNDGKS